MSCCKQATIEIVGNEPYMATYACFDHADELTGDGEQQHPYYEGRNLCCFIQSGK